MGYNVDQLRYYMAILNSPSGYIIYQYLGKVKDSDGKDINWKQFKIEMSLTERQEQLRKLSNKMILLKNAIKMKNPALAEGVYDNWSLKWLCDSCPYLEPCKAMRI